jgi:hypothetical protein
MSLGLGRVDMLDADILLISTAEASQGFDVESIGYAQASRGCRECDRSPLGPTASSEPCENCHCGGVGTSQLDRQRTLDLILRSGSLNHGKACNVPRFGTRDNTTTGW